MNKRLLSIAIPTWNRATYLDNALSYLLPQVNRFSREIEIIISDNCSTDNTKEIIKKYVTRYPDIDFVEFYQSENTGYYGNFKKCRELSSGKWFWLLSDNDFVNDNLISFIISTIKSRNNSTALFLKDWINLANKISITSNYKAVNVSKQELVEKGGYKLTLVSSIVFLNTKTHDTDIFEKLKYNSFIGFAFFLSSLQGATQATIIESPSLLIKESLKSFNVFTSFAIDLIDCVKFGIEHGYIDNKFEQTLINSVIANLTKFHYITYKIKSSIYGKDCGVITEIEKLLTQGFGQYEAYKYYLTPSFVKSRRQLIFEIYSKKIFKKIFKKICKKIQL